MAEALETATATVNEYFARERPGLFARRLEAFSPEVAAEVLSILSTQAIVAVWERISGDLGHDIVGFLSDKTVRDLLEHLSPTALVNLLTRTDEEKKGAWMSLLAPVARREISALLVYSEGSVGRSMDPHFIALRPSDTVDGALARLRKGTPNNVIYVVDDELQLIGRIPLERLALASPERILEDLREPVGISVSAVETMDKVIEAFAVDGIADVPVVDVEGRLVGHYQESRMAAVVQSDAMADLQTMVGASRDERALSPVGFAVRKRIGWLQVNLLTAFLAAAVVGLFEDTIAHVTALAVLLPVVAGQSGNAGAQALAVTMRGLALREIALRHWLLVTWKEARIGLLNGLAIAVTCGLGVFVWSGSMGLVLVICLSMVIAMIAAGLAGAMVPIILTRFNQDPATASSIVLTTVTDVAGFFAFLGIASLFLKLL